MSEPILVWRFEDAPKEFQDLSPQGGDESWLAVVPAGVDLPDWAEAGTSFGSLDVSVDCLRDGRRVLIGAH